jgi:DNA-binding response OmpR family regulator
MHGRDLVGARVLIVTGEFCRAAGWRTALLRRRFAVAIACADRTARMLAATGLYDVLVLDLADPLFDGLALCRQLRVDGVMSPILMVHPHGTPDDLLAGFDAGADAYLRGSFSREELLGQIGALWRTRKYGESTT